MAKRVFIVHRWGGTPGDDWYPWLEQKLKARGFDVVIPEMPNTENPKIDGWVSTIAKAAGKLNQEDYFIGHSIGCQAIMRFLEKQNERIGGILLVAGWLTLKGFETPEEKEVAEPWLLTPIDFDKIKRVADKITALFSIDDPYVPISDASIFREKLGAKTITEKDKGHFNEKEYEIILNEFLKLAE